MPKEKAPRNRTIDTPVAEGAGYLARCVRVEEPVADIRDLLDRTILGDAFSVCPLLPGESLDLIIADPPYNLTKSFNGRVFPKRKAGDYEAYTRRWLAMVAPLLIAFRPASMAFSEKYRLSA